MEGTGCVETINQIKDKNHLLGGGEMRDTSNITEEDPSEQSRAEQRYT